MSRHMFPAVAAVAWYVSVLAAADRPLTTTINLGGLRQVKAVLTTTDGEYVIKVCMLPVDCFDSATNARLNREKAQELAFQALARHLTGKEPVEFAMSGAQVDQVGTEGKSYVLSLRVPRRGITVVRQGDPRHEKPKPEEVRVAFSSDLLTRKRDYQHTLDKLAQGFRADLCATEEKAKDRKNDDDFFIAIAEIEERGVTDFGRLVEKVKEDMLLLTLEKEDLAGAIEARKAKLLEQLKDAVKRHQRCAPTRKESTR